MDHLFVSIVPALSELAQTVGFDQLKELERFAEIGRLSASLLHEINNPLTAAMLWLEQYENQQAACIRHARHSMDMLHRYVEAARRHICREDENERFSVRAELQHIRRIMLPLAKRQNVMLRFPSTTHYHLYGNPVKFQQIIANLIKNAIEAYELCEATRITKSVRLHVYVENRWLVIQVSDRGCGIATEKLERIFQSFYSTKKNSGRGLGIGLATVKRYVEEDFRGNIHVESSENGTCFTAKFKLN